MSEIKNTVIKQSAEETIYAAILPPLCTTPISETVTIQELYSMDEENSLSHNRSQQL